MIAYPEYLNSWMVDEIIECLPVDDRTTQALLVAAPGAYQDPGVALSDVWAGLSETVQRNVAAADAQNRRELGWDPPQP